MALHSSILSWSISWTEKSVWLLAMGSYRVRQNWETEHIHKTSLITKTCITVYIDVFVVAQSLSCVQLFVTPWTAAGQASLFITNLQSLLKLMSIESVMHPTILSSVILFSSCLQYFSASRSFQMSQFLASGGQSIGASASASVFTMNIQDWFPLGLTGLISMQSKGLSRVFSNTTVQKHQFFGLSLWSNSHIHTWLLGKP